MDKDLELIREIQAKGCKIVVADKGFLQDLINLNESDTIPAFVYEKFDEKYKILLDNDTFDKLGDYFLGLEFSSSSGNV